MVIVKSLPEPFKMEITNGVYTFTGDVPAANGGSGEYVSPFGLLRAAYACCLNVTARAIMEKRKIPYRGVEVRVDLDNENGVVTFHHAIDIDADLPEAEKQKIAKMAFTGCHVHKALEGKLVFPPADL